MIYKILDIFFVFFHTFLIIFNLFGWIWKPVRRINLITLLLTGASWFILGIFFGIGYCPLTDWHWKVKIKLGQLPLPRSYVEYLVETITGFDFKQSVVDTVLIIGFFSAVFFSVFFNIRDHILKKNRRSS